MNRNASFFCVHRRQHAGPRAQQFSRKNDLARGVGGWMLSSTLEYCWFGALTMWYHKTRIFDIHYCSSTKVKQCRIEKNIESVKISNKIGFCSWKLAYTTFNWGLLLLYSILSDVAYPNVICPVMQPSIMRSGLQVLYQMMVQCSMDDHPVVFAMIASPLSRRPTIAINVHPIYSIVTKQLNAMISFSKLTNTVYWDR